MPGFCFWLTLVVVIKLNKFQLFLAGFAVILLCYFTRQITFIVNSERATGEVINETSPNWGHSRPGSYSSTRLSYPVIKFQAAGQELTFVGESNLDYNTGDKVEVIYRKEDPKDAKIYSFFGFWFGKIAYFLIPLFLWAAFSLSYLDKGEYITLNFRNRSFGKSKYRKNAGDKDLDGDWNQQMKLE